MAAIATQKWSGRTKGKQVTSAGNATEQATVLFDVIQATDEDDAIASVAAVAGGFDIGTPWKTGSTNICNNITARLVSLGVYEVTCQFATPDTGALSAFPGNPLDQPATIQWQSVVITEPFDRDVKGCAVTNSAGDVPSNTPTRTYVYKCLKITRNESTYDINRYQAYENCVNQSAMVIEGKAFGGGGGGTAHSINVSAGAMKCVSIEPASSYLTSALYIPICYTFEIWDLTTIATAQPFQLRFLDSGSEGWYTSDGVVGGPSKGLFCNSDGNTTFTDVRLDGNTGVPLDANKQYVRNNSAGGNVSYPTIATPPASAISGSSTKTTETSPDGNAVFLIWQRYKTVDFSGLNL